MMKYLINDIETEETDFYSRLDEDIMTFLKSIGREGNFSVVQRVVKEDLKAGRKVTENGNLYQIIA